MTLDAFGVERGDLAKKAPESHLDVDSLNTPEGLDRGIAMTDAVRRYHQKKAKHGAVATLAGGAVAGAGGLSLYKLPRAGMATAVGGGALALGGLTHMQHHAVRADVARHNEAVLIGAKRQRAAAEEMAGAKPAGVAKGLLTHPEENTRAQNVAYGAGTATVTGAAVGHYLNRKGLGIGRKYVHEGDPVKGFGRTTKAVARVSPNLAAKGVVLGDKLAFHGKTPALVGASAGVLGAASGALQEHRKKDLAKYQLPGDNPQAEAARERKKSGLGLAGVGYLVASRHKDVTPGAVDMFTRPAKKGADAEKVLARDAKIANRTKAINTVSSRGGAAAVGLGLAMAGEGLASDWRHRKVLQRAQGKLDDHVKAYRENRDRRGNSLTKSAFGVEDPRIGKAFDPERQRHRRQSVYEGAATGGAVVSATGAGVLGRKALIQRQVANQAGPRAVAHHTELQESLNANAKPPSGTTTEEMGRRFAVAARKHRMAQGSAHTAVNAASKTRRFATLGGAAGLGAAALGGAAYGIHRRDTAGHGRGY